MPSHQGFEFHGGTTQLLCCLQLHVCPGWVGFSSDRLGRPSHAFLAHFCHTGKYTSSLGGWGEVATGKNKNMAKFSSLSFSVFWMVHLNLQLINTQKKAGWYLSHEEHFTYSPILVLHHRINLIKISLKNKNDHWCAEGRITGTHT